MSDRPSEKEPERLIESVTRDMLARRGGGSEPTDSAGTPSRAAGSDTRVVAIGSDHAGFRLKRQLMEFLTEELGLEVRDCGAVSEDPVDYPDIARAVAEEVTSGRAHRGIVVDGAGIGSTMAANKVRGVRCALCHDEGTVVNSRRHNDANMLALGSGVVNPGFARTLVRLWLRTPFDGGRHARRVEKIMRLEEP